MTLLLDDDCICCAHCKDGWLHQRKVEVFARHKEDSPVGLHIDIDIPKATSISDTSMEHNPSQRRDGIVIYFECETCGKISTLVISQHKGREYVCMDVRREIG